ncbi:hypothetical protein BU24DRAFT_495892 [Aaosphaeria arxii CBS 175.79]|uniref:HAUS augmin-like complex subunit 1 n=1 Tax=Aaosphaeria arxii CBS 175.79 TaxID=1450172 RepID=A0A6A5XG16_9PLEO|nr:uncharacterized protein BU24DRAFT_495892 [Aaosphaeria arxii CBS 175.79]KAF2011771.1 hypothetical protein BU24DRAFT_495892 [Aaosphaeria arxii CBS 175.79]
MDDLTPSDLFSPSKARAQRALTQDWAQIESWLSYKYAGRAIPTFERNEETLKVLRELSTANERADEDRTMIERLEREALKVLDESSTNEDENPMKKALIDNLTPAGADALTALTSTATTLDATGLDTLSMAHSIIHLTSSAQQISNNLAHIQTLQGYLQKQHSLLRDQLALLQTDPAFGAPPTLHRQTTEQVRQMKHVKAKIREYEDRFSSLQSLQNRSLKRIGDASSAEAMADTLEQQKALRELRTVVEDLEARLAVFAELPADKEAARRELGRLEVELDGLRRRRDALFESMVGN